MSSDGDKDRSSDLETRLARLVDGVAALGESLGEIPESLTQEWLDEQEARWGMASVGESSSMTDSSASAVEMAPEDEGELSSDPEEEVSPDPQEGITDSTEPTVLDDVESSRQSGDSENVSTGNVGMGPSADEVGFGGFVPNRAEWIAFSAYACAGALWAGVLALELVERESVDGIRGVILLSFVCSIILGFVVRREFHRPKDLSGPQGEIRFLREGLTLAMAGILGTAAGVGVGLGASDTELGVVIGWGASMGSGLGVLGMALVLFVAMNGSLRHGGRRRSWPGFGILAAVGTGLLAMGVMHIQEIVALVDSFADAQDQAEQFLDDAVGDKSDLPKHSADWVTTLAVSPLPDLFRVVLRQLYVFNFAVTALLLGLGTWLSARLMLTAYWPKRLEQAVTASTCVGYGLMWLSAALGLGTLMALDAAFLQVGSGPNEMKNEVTVLLGVLLITAGSGVTSGARHLAAGRRHLKKNL